jgi:hypothetical protein
MNLYGIDIIALIASMMVAATPILLAAKSRASSTLASRG